MKILFPPTEKRRFQQDLVLTKRFFGSGLTIQDVFTKPVKKYYKPYFKEIAFRSDLLEMFCEQQDIAEKVENVMREYVLYEIDTKIQDPYYHRNLEELNKLRTYFLGKNQEDLYTYFAHIARELERGGSFFWDIYEMIASINYNKKEGYILLSSFINRVEKKQLFFKSLANAFGVEPLEVRYLHIY